MEKTDLRASLWLVHGYLEREGTKAAALNRISGISSACLLPTTVGDKDSCPLDSPGAGLHAVPVHGEMEVALPARPNSTQGHGSRVCP